MPTRNFYVTVSNKFRGHEANLKWLLVIVVIGGIALLVVLSQIYDPKLIVVIGGKIWFSLTILIAILYMSVVWFYPDRDKNDFTVKESVCVLVLDVWLLMIFWAWLFME